MTGTSQSPRPERPRRRGASLLAERAPAVVLVASLALTLVAAGVTASVGRARDDAQFENAVQAASDRIESRVEAYETLLAGTAGLFATDPDQRVSAGQFRSYVERVELGEHFPGVRGVGYSALLWREGRGPADPDTLLAAAQGLAPDVTQLWPDPRTQRRTEVHAIVFLEPADRRNRAAIGYDMHADPVRRAAMDRARDQGAAAASGRVKLVQEIDSTAAQPGFLVYVPVYRGGAVPRTVEARRRLLVGFVYAPFRMGDLMRGIFGSERQPRVDFRIFDGAGTTREHLLADSRTLDGTARQEEFGPARVTRNLNVAGRQWTVLFAPHTRSIGARALSAERDPEPLIVGTFGVVVSIALTLVTAAEVRARQRVEQGDALRARFFAAMSHELRTPVNAVLGYNDLLLAGIYGELGDPQREGIERSQRAARHLLELVNDVLDLSKLEAGKMDVAPEPVVLDALLDDLRVTIGPLADARGCALELDARACRVTLTTDPRRLRQILLNLLSNATKFGVGRPVRVWCDRRAADHGRTPHVAVHVRDEGPGIAPDDQARIFEEFVQLPGSAPGGTGLGLPISRRLVELLGGTLHVQSAPGEGSTFTVLLPLDRPPRTAA